MLLTELLTDKRGPLAKIWMSAHQEKKLSKRDAMGIDIEESVEAILTHDEGPVTLRLSGQLMLGVTRIYSRKAQSLFEDCRYTRENITKAFRPGVVDLPEDQQRTSNNAITLADTRNDFDFLDWSWSTAMPPPPTTRESAGPSRLHLKTPTREYGAYNFGRIASGSIFGGSTPSRQSQDRDDISSKLDSHDFSGIDLGLENIDILAPSQQDDVEIARRNSTPRSDRLSAFGPGAKSMTPNALDDIVLPEDINLNLDVDLPLPGLDNRSPETSVLSSVPPLSPPPNEQVLNSDITPRTAAKISHLPAPKERSSPAAPKVKKTRLVQADSELELDESEFAMNRDNSDILTDERYIPADAEIVRLREIMDDPASHFLPTLKMGGENMFYAGPQDLAPELAGLFTFPTNILRKRREEGAEDDRLAKRARVEEVEQESVEDNRRVSMVPSAMDPYGGEDSGYFAGDQPVGQDIPEIDDLPIVTPTKQRVRSPSLAPSRAESIAREIQNQRSTGDHMLAMFEKDATVESQSASQIQGTPNKSLISEPISKTSSGYSKNTGMAMGLLRREIEAIEDEDKVIGLAQIADKASKRAASAFFFELLVLGTRDAIKLDQKTAFGDVDIRAKAKLFAEISA